MKGFQEQVTSCEAKQRNKRNSNFHGNVSQTLKQKCATYKKMPVYKVRQVIIFTYLGTNCIIKYVLNITCLCMKSFWHLSGYHWTIPPCTNFNLTSRLCVIILWKSMQSINLTEVLPWNTKPLTLNCFRPDLTSLILLTDAKTRQLYSKPTKLYSSMFARSYRYMKRQDFCLLLINNQTFPNLQLELGQSYGALALTVACTNWEKQNKDLMVKF